MNKTNTVWLIYDKKRYLKSSGYRELYSKYFEEKGFTTKVLLVDDINFFESKYLPNIVIMRTYRPELTQFFEKNNVKVYNNLHLAEYGNNKYLAYNFIKQMDIPLPETQLLNKFEDANMEFPLVAKSIFGHGGSEVFWANNKSELDLIKSKIKENEFLIQRPVSDLGKDLRVYVVGNKVIASMLRYNPNDFRSNYSLGGKASLVKLSAEQKCIVDKIISKLQIGMAGIDFIFDNNKLIFNEIEDIVGSRMLYANSDIDIVKLYVNHICESYYH